MAPGFRRSPTLPPPTLNFQQRCHGKRQHVMLPRRTQGRGLWVRGWRQGGPRAWGQGSGWAAGSGQGGQQMPTKPAPVVCRSHAPVPLPDQTCPPQGQPCCGRRRHWATSSGDVGSQRQDGHQGCKASARTTLGLAPGRVLQRPPGSPGPSEARPSSPDGVPDQNWWPSWRRRKWPDRVAGGQRWKLRRSSQAGETGWGSGRGRRTLRNRNEGLWATTQPDVARQLQRHTGGCGSSWEPPGQRSSQAADAERRSFRGFAGRKSAPEAVEDQRDAAGRAGRGPHRRVGGTESSTGCRLP